MALSKTIIKNIFGEELTLENAYIKIDSIQGDKNNIEFRVQMFNKTKEYLIDERFYNFIPDVLENSPNFIKQGYEYLKTLPEFQDAVDVLEEGQMA